MSSYMQTTVVCVPTLLFDNLLTIVASIALPIFFFLYKRSETKRDLDRKRNIHIQRHSLVIAEAESKLTACSRRMARQTAQAVLTGKPNGELTKAIAKFDKEFDKFQSIKMDAINKLSRELKGDV